MSAAQPPADDIHDGPAWTCLDRFAPDYHYDPTAADAPML